MRPRTVYRWITQGLPQQAEPSKRSYLIAVRRAGRLFVKKADLRKLLETIQRQPMTEDTRIIRCSALVGFD